MATKIVDIAVKKTGMVTKLAFVLLLLDIFTKRFLLIQKVVPLH